MAKKYNLNYAKLVSACKENNIPYSTASYWSKKNMGIDISNDIISLPTSEVENITLYLKNNNSNLIKNSDVVEDKKKSPNAENVFGNILNALEFLAEDERSKVTGQEIINKIKNLPTKDQRNISYKELIDIVQTLTANEIIELSNVIGYPVFTRMCMGELKHKFVLLQDGAAAIIVNKKGQILLQSRADRNKWGLPGGCQELGERFQDTVIREIKEETNLDVQEEDLQLIEIISGSSRRNDYPNGDIVLNNTVLYCIKKYSGELKWDSESKNMKFFDLENLPPNQNDPDLINLYLEKLQKSKL